MAKFALLIGVSEYELGLTSLPAAAKDVEAMQQVLQDPEIGSFDDVKPLLNLERQAMEEAIETLFKGRQKDDLVLLFFSGHGIKDESGKLYFATRNTRKTDKGELVRSTTVSANFVHEIMSNSSSRRQVVILDCCFSGAFANGLSARDNGSVDIRNQLGGEGRAVLTSSTSTQLSFEQRGADLSIYTRFLVEGIETGAADTNDNGVITVDELHEYAKKKVQEVAPTMKPEIYPIKEGYTILLAKAPVGDPKLRYRKEVERFSRRGEISPTGRRTLERLKSRLELSLEEASAIENEVLQPYREYQERLQEYEQALVEAVQREFPLSNDTQEDLQRFQQVLGLRDEDIALVKASIIAKQQSSTQGNPTPHPSRKKNFLLFMGLFVGAVSCFGAGVWFSHKPTQPSTTVAASCQNNAQAETGLKISLGDKILLKGDTNSDKQAGIQAFAENNFQTAIDKFKLYRQKCGNDPEALIYLNNAHAAKKGNLLKIAVSVPIGSNLNVAKEILRGVAQAQDEVNRSGGINAKLLQVAIANDNNDYNIAQQVAAQFVKDSSILAVVGHNASNASIGAAPGYQQEGLVMIAPTGFSKSLSSMGNYIFRIAPKIDLIADSLRNTIKLAGKTNILICVDPKAMDNQSLKEELTTTIEADGSNINSTECDPSAPNFNPSVVISQAISTGANGLVLSPYIDRIKEALVVAKGNKGRLALFGSPTMYTDETLKKGKADVDGMVLATPWHPKAIRGNPFAQKAEKLWGGPVSWRTATAYDGTLAIITGLQQSNTRYGLQKVLHSSSFAVDGATGKFQFLQSGDRSDKAVFLVKVQQKSGTNDYEFVPLQP